MVATLRRTDAVFQKRVIYLSAIPGMTLGCDLSTGLNAAGAAISHPVGVANAAAINAILATATAISPVKLWVDATFALGAALATPDTGYVDIEATAEGNGFFMLPGSNCNLIQNIGVGTTNLANFNAVHPSSAQPIVGKNVAIKGLTINGGRGIYPNGLVNSGAADGTLSGAGSPDARGLPSKFFYTGIIFVGIDNLVIEDCQIYDAASSAIYLLACSRPRIANVRITVPTPVTEQNQDGIHLCSGCWGVTGSNNWLSSGDDAVAINLDEGEGGLVTDPDANADIHFDNTTLHSAITAARVFGQVNYLRRISLTNFRGDVQWWGCLIGSDAGGILNTDTIRSILLDGWQVRVTNPTSGGALVWINANCGLVELSRMKMIEPTAGTPFVLVGDSAHAPAVASLRVAGFECHRNTFGSNTGSFVQVAFGSVANLEIDGFAVTDNGSYPDIPYFLDITGSASVGRLWIGKLDMAHIGALCNDWTKVGSVAGPGCVGLSLPDSVMANGWPYIASDHGNVPAVKVGGTVKIYSIT
jgi:hypothetical protein